MNRSDIEDCVFCKIIKKDIPANIVYEDKDIIAFTPRQTEAKGHILVITKKHYDNIFDVSDNDLKKLIINIKKIARGIKKGLGATGVNILNASGKDAQQSVQHLHFHLIPRFPNDGLDAWIKKGDLNKYDLKEINEKIKKGINYK